MSLCILLCKFVAIKHLFSQSMSIVLRLGGQLLYLLYVIFSCSSVRCIRWPGLALIRVFYHCVIEVMLLVYVVCTLNKVNWNSNHCLFSELLSACFYQSSAYSSCDRGSSIGVRSIKVQNVPICKAGPGSNVE